MLNVIRTAEVLQQATSDFLLMTELSEFLKPHGVSPTQYNVLRILRGAEPAGATCSQIGERLVTRDPDITRLLDRMEARGLIGRERSTEDRRVVITRISERGLKLVGNIDQPLTELSRSRMGKIGRDALTGLIEGLERMREAFETEDNLNRERTTK